MHIHLEIEVRGMDKAFLDVYIIQTPDSDRSIPLLNTLRKHPRIRVNLMEATMLQSESDLVGKKISVDQNFFQTIEGRDLTFPEVGCAHSHNLARQLVMNTTFGGVILEDDARISDVETFFKSTFDFLQSNSDRDLIIVLTGMLKSHNKHKVLKSGDCPRLVRLLGSAPLAVAYALTPRAAGKLFNANSPIKYVADWPVVSSTFCFTNPPTVNHGDGLTISSIAPTGNTFRLGPSLGKKLSLFTFYSFFRNRRFSASLSEYVNWVFKRRVYWYVDTILIFMRNQFRLS
jgi:GR25 family glycosyltransferase involved in LPS biosynthesis